MIWVPIPASLGVRVAHIMGLDSDNLQDAQRNDLTCQFTVHYLTNQIEPPAELKKPVTRLARECSILYGLLVKPQPKGKIGYS